MEKIKLMDGLLLIIRIISGILALTSIIFMMIFWAFFKTLIDQDMDVAETDEDRGFHDETPVQTLQFGDPGIFQ